VQNLTLRFRPLKGEGMRPKSPQPGGAGERGSVLGVLVEVSEEKGVVAA